MCDFFSLCEKKMSEEEEKDAPEIFDEHTVMTRQGPVRYVFTSKPEVTPPPPIINVVIPRRHYSFSSDDEKEEESPRPKRKRKRRIPPPPPPTQSYEWLLQLTVGLMLLGMAYLYYTVPHHHHTTVGASPPQRTWTIRDGFGHKTHAVDWKRQNSTNEVRNALEHTLRRTKRKVLCMHHLQEWSQEPYKACSVFNQGTDQVYFMLNPWIRGGSKEKKGYQESSVACSGMRRNMRHDTIILEWTRPQGGHLYAMFDDPEESVMLQIVLDEFKGNHHCGPPADSRAEVEPKGIEQKRTKSDKGAVQEGTSK